MSRQPCSAALRTFLCALILLLVPSMRGYAGQTQYDCGDPTADEQLVLEMINRARANPTAEGQRLQIDINEGLTSAPTTAVVRPPLIMNRILLAAARAHSKDMNDRSFFDHVNPDGLWPWDRITNAGYSYTVCGENIAWGTAATAAYLEDILMKDEGYPERGHRRNLLDISTGTVYREIGVGFYAGDRNFITQDFGTSSVGPFVLGVVYNDANSNGICDVGEGVAGVSVTPDVGANFGVSSTSGGYGFPVGSSGTITLTASGGGLTAPLTQTVTLTGENVKVDFITSGGGGGGGGGGGTVPLGVGTPPTVSGALTASGTVGVAFGYTITATGATPMAFATSELPPGLVLVRGTITGTPTAAGTFTVMISATNGSGSNTQPLMITIAPAAVINGGPTDSGDSDVSYQSKTATDTDGDGFADEIEIALGADPKDPNSTPLGGSSAGVAQSLPVSKMNIKLDFAHTTLTAVGPDSISLAGLLPVRPAFSPAGQKVTLDVGGVIRSFTLDAKGNSTPKGLDSFKIKIKRNKISTADQDCKFAAKFTKGSFSALLADEGLVGTANAKNVLLFVPVAILFDSKLFNVEHPQLYTAKAGLSGVTK